MDLSGGGNRLIMIAIVALNLGHGIREKHAFRNHQIYYTTDHRNRGRRDGLQKDKKLT